MKKSLMYFGVLFVFFLGACQKEEEIIRPVAVYTVNESVNNISLTFPSIVEAGNSSVLSFKVAGNIESFNKEVGAFVKKGELLVNLDERDYDIQLNAGKEKELAVKNAYLASKAQADNARKQFARAKALYKEKVLPKKKYDEVVAMVEGAKAQERASYAQYQEAKQGRINRENQKKDTKLLAPFDGYITKKFSDIGSVVSAGMPVLSFSSVGKKKVQINVSEKDIQYIEQAKEFVLVVKDKKYKLILQTLGKVKQSLDLVYPVVFYIENDKDLLVGTECSVYISYKNENIDYVSIPVEAVVKNTEDIFVWVVEHGSIVKKNITIIKAEENGIILVSGVKVGDSVVIRGIYDVYEGQKVRVLEEFSKTNIGEIL